MASAQRVYGALMDEVFGEANFLAQVVVNLNPKGRQLGPGFATSHEYLLVYARNATRCVLDASTNGTSAASALTTDSRNVRPIPGIPKSQLVSRSLATSVRVRHVTRSSASEARGNAGG